MVVGLADFGSSPSCPKGEPGQPELLQLPAVLIVHASIYMASKSADISHSLNYAFRRSLIIVKYDGPEISGPA